MKFEKKQIVTCLTGKYKNQKVEILKWSGSHTPTLYVCKTDSGKEIALYETEID